MSVQYPIQIVARLSGLSPHVIRIWEKRYGAVAPARTDTNRRLYTEAEVERLRAGITALAGGWVHNGHPDTEGECKGAPVTQEPAPVARRGASNWSKREDSTWIDKL